MPFQSDTSSRARPRVLASRAARVLAASVCLAAACERGAPPPEVDTLGPALITPTDSAPPAPASGWIETAGAVLLAPGAVPGQAQVVFPSLMETSAGELDSASVQGRLAAGTRVLLLARSGGIGEATVATDAAAVDAPAPASEAGCTQWPTARLTTEEGADAPAGWTIGFVAGLVDPLPLDSLTRLPRADSARLAAAITSIASALPNDTAAQFRGLPFAVRSARRFAPAPGVEAVVAELVRRVNQEARPLEEHILLVAERDSGVARGTFRPVYSERSIGADDEVVTSEVLAAARVRSGGEAIVVLYRDLYEGGRYALLERVAPRLWRLRWTSIYTGC